MLVLPALVYSSEISCSRTLQRNTQLIQRGSKRGPPGHESCTLPHDQARACLYKLFVPLYQELRYNHRECNGLSTQLVATSLVTFINIALRETDHVFLTVIKPRKEFCQSGNRKPVHS